MIYTREECINLIDELEIIFNTRTKTNIDKKKITPLLMESILYYTKNCRDRLSERIYWILNGIEDYPFCKQCGKQFQPRFFGLKNGYPGGSFCSSRCGSLNNEVQEKNRKSCLENLGVKHPAQSIKVQEKMQVTMEERHGVKFAAQSPIFQEKVISTNNERYNVDYTFQSEEIKEKAKQTNLERRNVEYPMQCELVKHKSRETCKEKYNVEYISQDINIFNKIRSSSYRLKELVLSSGKIITYQGYENIAYLKLLENGYLEEQIIIETDFIPQIKYQLNNIDKVYFPDIFIPHENKIIEVKSIWTYEKDLDKNLTKRQACLDQGYQFEFWICSDKKLLEIK